MAAADQPQQQQCLSTALSSAARSVRERDTLHQIMRSQRLSCRDRRLGPGTLQLSALQDGQSSRRPSADATTVMAPAAASVVASPAGSEQYRITRTLQAEKLELAVENQRLRRHAMELEQTVCLLKASQSSQRWLKTQTARPLTTEPRSRQRDNVPAPKLRPKTPTVGGNRSSCSATEVQKQILRAVEASQGEVAALPAAPASSVDSAIESWSAASWIASLRVSQIVADALLLPLGRGSSSMSPGGARLQLAYVMALRRHASYSALRELLDSPALLDALANELWTSVERLTEAGAASGNELLAKFQQEPDVFTMDFGGLSTFFSGLDALVGTPSPHLRPAMQREHCESADSHDLFEGLNYGICTMPRVEFHFVTADADAADEWPVEARLEPSRRRVRKPLALFLPEMRRINQRLRRLECAPCVEEELVGARLYTGPMYSKYNAVLRGVRSKSSRQFAKWFAGCKVHWAAALSYACCEGGDLGRLCARHARLVARSPWPHPCLLRRATATRPRST